MTDKEMKPTLPGEGLGVLLLVVGLIPLVLVSTALVKSGGESVENLKPMARVANGFVRALGYAPSLLLYGCMTTLGGALFLGYSVHRPGRHLLGMVGVTLGVATLAGSIFAGGGGVLGDAIGGTLSRGLGMPLGILIGLAIVSATVVVAYLDGKIPMPKKLGTGATLSTALTELDDAGVSNAESSALAADASTLAYMEELWKGPADTIQIHPIPPSPYPEDVRLKGEVPKGASPLTKQAPPETAEDVQQQTTPEADPVAASQAGSSEADAHRWERAKAKLQAELSADSDLGTRAVSDADTASADDPFRSTIPVESQAQDNVVPAEIDLPKSDLPPGVRPLVVDQVRPLDAPSHSTSPISPVWERAKSEDVPLVDESGELDIVMDLSDFTEPAAPEGTAADAGTLPKLNFESLEFESKEVPSATPQAAADQEAPARPIWEEPQEKGQSAEALSTAHDPFAGESSTQDPAEALADLTEAEDAVLNQIDELEDELEREMEKIRRMEAQTEGLLMGAGSSIAQDQPVAIGNEPGLFGELETTAEAEELVAEEEPELAEDEECEEEELEEGEKEAAEFEEEDEENENENEEEGEDEEEEEGELEEGEIEEEEELEEGEEYEYEEDEEEEEEDEDEEKPAAAELEEGEEEEEEEEEEEGELEEGEEYEYEEDEEEEDEDEEKPAAAELEEGEEEEEEEEEEEGELEEGEEYEYEEEEEDEEEEEEEEEEPAAATELEEGEEEEELEESEEEAAELEDGEEEEEEEDGDDEEEGEYEEYEYEEFEEEEGEEEEEEEEEETAEASDEEPEVEIQPAPSARKATGRSAKWSHGDLIREAGVFLIERDRVGVSLLQRQFELEFDAAQALLAEIEEAGLIEPYMGGQKRAILLDLEAWLDRSPSS
jgi:hypothetical protein